MSEQERGWIGVDIDGTLAYYDKYKGPGIIGAPIQPMVEKVKKVLDEDVYDVRIFTSRVNPALPINDLLVEQKAIAKFTKDVFGVSIPSTAIKDHLCVEIWDDRARQVVLNKGKFINE